jgi:hypothetical protein
MRNVLVVQEKNTRIVVVNDIKPSNKYSGTGNIFHKRAYFLGEWGGKYFMGKGMLRVGFGLANLLNREPIPQNATFSVEV